MKSILMALCILALPVAVEAGKTISLQGDHGLEPIRLKELSRQTRVDLRLAIFNVANSRNRSPGPRHRCEHGPNDINRYPFAIENSRGVTVVGGLFHGTVPLDSDWLWTYCNSAALRIEDSPNASIFGLRMHRPWDAIRIDDGSPEFMIDRVWITNARDDCVENDYLMSGTIRNSLFDGCFVGISVSPTRKLKRKAVLEMDGVLMRLAKFSYKGRSRHGLPVKMRNRAARLNIKNSIVAVEAPNMVGGHHAPIFWASIGDCSNNTLLWLGSGPLPKEISSVRSCFTVLRGSEARKTWAVARRNWINCNSDVSRFRSDPVSLRSRCNSDH